MTEPATYCLPDVADRVLISVNARAGRRSVENRITELIELLRSRGYAVEATTDLAQVGEQANRWHAEGRLRAVVSVGGDGTAAEILNRTNPGIPLVPFPSGTSNLLARQLGYQPDPRLVCETVVQGRCAPIDAGCASGRFFLLMVGCGFDAEVVRRVHDCRTRHPKGHLSYWSYFKPIVQSIRSYQYPEIRVYCDPSMDGSAREAVSPVVAPWVFVFNLPRYGWGLPLAPQADCRDGLMDLYALGGGSIWHALRYVVWAQLGAHERLAQCNRRQVRRLRIESEEPVAYQLDGDPGGMLPVDVEVMPGRLTLLAPPGVRAGS